jgi:hypothetical protein
VSATIGRDYVVDFVVGNRRPCTVHFNFVVVANHATLGRPTIHEIAARASAIISFERRVEPPMPLIVPHSVVSLLRRRARTETHKTALPRRAMNWRRVAKLHIPEQRATVLARHGSPR